MMRWMLDYIRERYKLQFWLPVSILLVLASLIDHYSVWKIGADPLSILIGWPTFKAFILCHALLLLLRILDDWFARRKDAVQYPDRLIVKSENGKPVVILVVGLMLFLIWSLERRGLWALIALLGFLLPLYKWREPIPNVFVRLLAGQVKYPAIVMVLSEDYPTTGESARSWVIALVLCFAVLYELLTEPELRDRLRPEKYWGS